MRWTPQQRHLVFSIIEAIIEVANSALLSAARDVTLHVALEINQLCMLIEQRARTYSNDVAWLQYSLKLDGFCSLKAKFLTRWVIRSLAIFFWVGIRQLAGLSLIGG